MKFIEAEKRPARTHPAEKRPAEKRPAEKHPAEKQVFGETAPDYGNDCLAECRPDGRVDGRERGRRPAGTATVRNAATAHDAALKILAAGANSKKMLREKLIRKGYPAEETEAAVEEMDALGFIGEVRLLESYVNVLARRSYGVLRIRAELIRKFDRDILESHLDALLEEIDFITPATALAEKNAHRGREYVIGKLRRQGYPGNVIREVLLRTPFR